jgi:hypothetical protein
MSYRRYLSYIIIMCLNCADTDYVDSDASAADMGTTSTYYVSNLFLFTAALGPWKIKKLVTYWFSVLVSLNFVQIIIQSNERI